MQIDAAFSLFQDIGREKFLVEIGQLVPGQGPGRRHVLPGGGKIGVGVFLPRLPSGKAHGAGAADQGQRRQQGQERRAAAAGDAGDAVAHLPLARRHGGGGQQRVGAAALGDQGQQGLPVGPALRLSQPGQRPLVAGQFTVRLRAARCQPHQRVKPPEHQAEAPQRRPQGVQVPGVGLLMGQDVAQPRLVPGRLAGDVDGGPQQPKETGGGDVVAEINRAGAVHVLQGQPGPAQLPCKTQIGPEEPERHDAHSNIPYECQDLERLHPLPVKDHVLPGPVHHAVGAVPLQEHGPRLPVGQFLRRVELRRIGGVGQKIDALPRRRLHRLLQRLRGAQHAVPGGGQLHRQQQTQQHQQPDGILHPPGNAAAKQPAQQQHRQDQRR